jgi:hypothetical protein
MNRRLVLGCLAVAAMALTAGCFGLGGGSVSDERLDEEPAAPYVWNASTDVYIEVTANARFTAVYTVPSDRGTVELYRSDGFGGRNAIPVSAVRYRYPNGTVVSGSSFAERGGEVRRTRDAVVVTLPTDGPGGEGGKLAFTSSSTPKRFTLPVFVEGTYEVVLPPDRSVSFPVFGSVRPGGYQTREVDDRVHITWSEAVTSRSLAVQFYLERDLTVFGAAVAVLLVVGAAGLLRYQRQIRRLEEQRQELGLDVETEDDEFDDGPPPGMR